MTSTPKNPEPGHGPVSKTGHGPVSKTARLDDLIQAPENEIYRPLSEADPDIRRLAKSIRELGILEPLRITRDNFIISGHRRAFAAELAGLEVVPVIVEPFKRSEDRARFVRLHREANRYRDRNAAERVAEAVIDAQEIDPVAAHAALRRRREQADREREGDLADLTVLDAGEAPGRCRITKAKRPMLDAGVKVIEANRKYWPLSDRQVHYMLLNDPPLRHASKPESRYRNDHRSYKDLTELLTRARLAGLIPMEAIADPTRSTDIPAVKADVGEYVEAERRHFLTRYRRDLTQSQPDHVEILTEKNTLLGILRPIAQEHNIPITSLRGYASLPTRAGIARRWRRSGKDGLILLAVSDFDPEGEDLAAHAGRSLRTEFGAEPKVVKVAVTAEQFAEYRLPKLTKAKKKSSRRKKFVDKHGQYVAEVEALPPAELQRLLREAIESVFDMDAYRAEIDREAEDAAALEALRGRVWASMRWREDDDE